MKEYYDLTGMRVCHYCLPINAVCTVCNICLLLCIVDLKNDLEQEEQGPSRNTADFRIKKAQVSVLGLM